MRRSASLLLILMFGLSLAGCAQRPALVNPAFDISIECVTDELDAMRREASADRPRLDRPVVVLDGIGAWGSDARRIRQIIADRTRGDVIAIWFPFAFTFDDCRRAVIERVDRTLGGASDRETIEVDIVGLSMGGVVARYAALDDLSLGKRLKIRRLYTISAPLTGAELARRFGAWSFVPLHRDLRPDSSFYRRLAGSRNEVELTSYPRLNDSIVGARYASLRGRGVYWLSTGAWEIAHFEAMSDPRFIADIVRRLRGDSPLTHGPPSPIPDGAD